MRVAELSPVSRQEQTQRPLDLFLIFVGANIVATTLQVGANLADTLPVWTRLWVIGIGAIGGAGIVALLAPVGSRLGVPSIVAARAVLGFSGAHALALLLFVTNFAWIALNNVIAGSITVRLTGVGTTGLWAVGLGVIATLVVAGGPRGVAFADRLAVPLLALSGIVFTVACLRMPWPAPAPTSEPSTLLDALRGLDIVAGYQVSWLLMFADYPRYVASPRKAAMAVFLGLALTALWFMPLGLLAATIANSTDPGDMVHAVGIGWWGAGLLILATLTTNFVNIYMSALAFKSLFPSAGDRATVWLIGGVGASLGVLSTAWINGFVGMMLLLGAALMPMGGILLAHYVVLREPVHVPDLYATDHLQRAQRRWWMPGIVAWVTGALVFKISEPIGAALPSLLASILVYVVLQRTRGTR